VWVVEDDDWIRKLVEKIVKEQGCAVSTFSDASKVICRLENGRSELPDMVITDLRLPGIDGFEIVEKLIAKEFSVSSIAMMSGYWDSESVYRASKLGVKQFRKPFKVNDLLQLIIN
jgi:two-component system nitrogen regulation response regulator GlnG